MKASSPGKFQSFCLCHNVSMFWFFQMILHIEAGTKWPPFRRQHFLNTLSWMKMLQFRLQFHLSLFLRAINNISALVQIMAWRRPGDKPLPEPMMACLLTHTCITRPQWVKLPLSHWSLNKIADIFADNIFICIFMNENMHILIEISLKFVPMGVVNKKSALVWVMDWHPLGDSH